MASKNPRQVGADRIVDAAAVYELYGGPAIVIDYGTATTLIWWMQTVPLLLV